MKTLVKLLSHFAAILIIMNPLSALHGQCTLGFDTSLGANSSHAPNYLLGSAINVANNYTLTSLGMIAISPGVNFKVGVYNSIGGNPGNLLTEGSGTTVAGVNVINVPDVALPPGTYFYMAIFQNDASISYTTNTPDVVWYISLPYSSNLPTSFGAPITYTQQAFSYYFIGTSVATGVDTQTACGSYTWIDGITYTANNNTASHTIPNGAANGCDSLVTLNLTVTNLPNIATTLNGITITASAGSATYAWLDCDNGNALISGATNQSFTPSANGNYAVQVTQNGCIDTSNCIAITSLAIDENSFGLATKLFPNPTNGLFTIDLGEKAESIQLSIVDLSGKQIESMEYKSTDVITHEFKGKSGTYFLITETEKQKTIFKLIKE